MFFLILGIIMMRKKDYALWSDICLAGGDVGLAYNCFYYKAIPVFIVNFLIVIITLFNIRKDLKARQEQRKGEESVFKSLGYKNKKDYEKRAKCCGQCFYFSRIKVKRCNFDGKETSEFSLACRNFVPIETYGVS